MYHDQTNNSDERGRMQRKRDESLFVRNDLLVCTSCTYEEVHTLLQIIAALVNEQNQNELNALGGPLEIALPRRLLLRGAMDIRTKYW